VKVIDFGLAKAAAPPQTSAIDSPTLTSPVGITGVGVLLGTAAYMSPEQARGKPIDKRSDIWAFGCVLYEMLTGRRAFDGEDVSLTLSQVLQRDPDWSALPPQTPPAVRQLLGRCVERDLKRRVQDIGEAWLALEARLRERDQAGSAPSSALAGSLHRRILSSTTVATLLAFGLFAAGLSAGWILKPAGPGRDARIVRLTIALPAGERLPGLWSPLALSPDGATLAYVANGRLYLRRLDSPEARPVLGSEGAWSPFFSADSASVAFFSENQLKRASVAGGRAAPIIDAAIPAGGSWGSDGRIYFARSQIGGLWRVPAAGGAPEPVTLLDREKGEVSHRWPQVLPGGRAVLFTAWRGPGWDEIDLQMRNLETGEQRVLATGANGGRYLPSGHLVYGRAGELTAAPFDLDRLEVSGPGIPLGVQLRSVETVDFAASDTGSLAFVSGQGQFERRLIWIDRSGRVEPLPAQARAYESARLSPDGERAALTVAGGTWGIWIHELARGTQTLLTPPSASSQWAVWTADGSRVIYRGTRSGYRNVYWKPSDGSGREERLTTGDNMQTPNTVSADGKMLAFDESHADSGSDIWLLPLDQSGRPRPFLATPANEAFSQLSSDGRWLAYRSDASGRHEIFVQSIDSDAGARVLVSPHGGEFPRWSRDGRELFYMEGDAMMAVDIATQPALKVGRPRLLFRNASLRLWGDPYSVSPDGQRFLAIQDGLAPEASTQIHIVLNWTDELKRLVPAK
jgi:hypothetical protein